MYLCNMSAKSAERKALARLRKLIHPYCWGTSDRFKEKFSRTTKKRILDFFGSLRLGIRSCFLPKPKTEGFMKHFTGYHILYCQADGRRKTPETLIMIDIDCHSRGTYEGALQCVQWLMANGFPNLFWCRSTNGRGIHAYVVIRKLNIDDVQLDLALVSLERWLQYQHHLNRWDIELIEVKGRPPIYRWGNEKYELLDVQMGSLAKVPVELLDRPEDFMATTSLRVARLCRLGSEVPRGWNRQTYCSTYCLPLTTDSPSQITSTDISMWVPETGSGVWCPWIEHMARFGLIEEDSLGSVVYELAKWLLWVELFDLDDRIEQATELLQVYIQSKNNGHVSRLLEGRQAEVLSQVRRIVESADNISQDSSEVFARIRQARKDGKYRRKILIAPLLSGSLPTHTEVEDICTTYCLPLRDDPLSPSIEAKLIAYAKSHKMRKTKGEYPFVRFSRRLIHILYSRNGSARLSTAFLTSLVSNVHQQDRFKHALRGLNLLRDWSGTYRSMEKPCLYRLTDEAMEAIKNNFAASDGMTQVSECR